MDFINGLRDAEIIAILRNKAESKTDKETSRDKLDHHSLNAMKDNLSGRLPAPSGFHLVHDVVEGHDSTRHGGRSPPELGMDLGVAIVTVVDAVISRRRLVL